MFQDDAFAPTNCEEFADYDYISNSNDTFELKKVDDSVKRFDKRYHKVVRPFGKVWKDGKYYKNVSIEYYGSGDIGSNIRNAVTGQRMSHFVGSLDQDLYFSVSVSNGENKRERAPVHLFYSSPEEYENHQFMELSETQKEQWREKNSKAKIRNLNLGSKRNRENIIIK